MPGEISLAHNGVLFLDEFPEFSRMVLEVMRQPLEEPPHLHLARQICHRLSRGLYARGEYESLSLRLLQPSHTRVSVSSGSRPALSQPHLGPLLDRIDLQVEIFPVPFESLASQHPAEPSEAIRARVIAARAVQTARFAEEKGVYCNAQMNRRMLERHAALDVECAEVLRQTMTRLDMSARAYDRILKVARTIADLDYSQRPGITPEEAAAMPVSRMHLNEALAYRSLDRGNWGATITKTFTSK